MRVLLAALSLLVCAASSHAQGRGVIGGLAGSIDNAVEAASLQAAAKVLAGGAYTITNVATGQALTYEADGNHITPEDGSGTPVNILGYGGGVSWVRLQIGEKDKCMSAQWGGSYNLAGVMYACAVDEGGDVTRADNTLEPTKQWWLLVPVGSDLANTGHSNNVLFAAQSESVATRQKAHKNGIVAHFNKKNGRRSLHGGSSSSNRFELVSRAAKRTRKKWFERSSGKGKGSKATKKAASSQKKKAASSKPKPKSSKKVAAPKPKKKVVPKAKAKAPAEKKKTTTKAKKVSSSSKKKTASSSKKPASGVVGVKLNVAVNRKYWIIPVDHLIDMHTLALTGHQIDSFRAQSTALDLWDANDKYQQWTIERA